MPFSPSRRLFLLATATLPFTTGCSSLAGSRVSATATLARLEQLERQLNGRLGLYALNTANGAELDYRANERFPLCSTFKVLAAAALLQKSVQQPGLMQQLVHYPNSEIVSYSPITSKHTDSGMTVAELCAAAIQYSDNTAANQMLKLLGGPQALTAFARTLGNTTFRLDRWETELNSAIPGDPRDTATPKAMGESLQRLVLGDALPAPQREQLKTWLLGNTTGGAKIKAGIPADWQIGDKTGGGQYGSANDLAVLWPPKHAPIVLAIYTTQHEKEAGARNDIIAAAARVVVEWLGR
jgi:beta-lactamase class A